MPEYRSRFSSEFENVARARRAVVAFARHWFSGTDLTDIESSVGEALANAAEHGAKTRGEVDIHCYVDDDVLVVDVKDDGDGFDRWSAIGYVRPLSPAPRGWGIFIMRELMDDIEYTDHGSRVRLMKRMPQSQMNVEGLSDAG